jgi:putative hydrolase of the HAD superfamily
VGYRAILFDLFDTLVLFDRRRLPLVEVDGRSWHSTAGLLHDVFRRHAPQVDLATFVDALLWSWQEAERLRSIDHREVPAPARFRLLFGRLGLDADAVPPALLEALLDSHRRGLTTGMEFPAHHAPLLRDLARQHRLAVVSNFDFGPTARGVLEAAGVASLFDTIVISDEVGWRKPKPIIFEEALRRLGTGAGEALFVGDRADIDVVGARGVDMDVAWVNREGSALPAGLPSPQFQIRDLAELRAITAAGPA